MIKFNFLSLVCFFKAFGDNNINAAYEYVFDYNVAKTCGRIKRHRIKQRGYRQLNVICLSDGATSAIRSVHRLLSYKHLLYNNYIILRVVCQYAVEI